MAERGKGLSVAQLREILKAQGVKNTSIMRKAQLQQLYDELEEKKKQQDTVIQESHQEPHQAAEVQKIQSEQKHTEEQKERQEQSRVTVKETNEDQSESVQQETHQDQSRLAVQETRQERTRQTAQETHQGRSRSTAQETRQERPRQAVQETTRRERPRQAVQETTRQERPRQTVQETTRQERPRLIFQETHQERPRQTLQETRQERPRQTVQETTRQERPRSTAQETCQEWPRSTIYQTEQESREYDRRRQSARTVEETEIPGFGQLDSGMMANGILEVMPDGYGFIRCENYLPGDNDVYVSPAQIRRFNLKTGDIVYGNMKVKTEKEKFSALLYVRTVNGLPPYEAQKRCNFEDMTPIFPNNRICLETPNAPVSMRIMDLVSPIGRGQRGMIVSPPKTGKTTLLKQVARAINTNYPEMNMIILLIDERPEEVTDIKEYIEGKNVEVIYSTFDELPEHHKRVSEMVLERAKRLVEHKKDVVILLDSITRLARAYNLTVPPSGRTLSGGLDPAALHMPKKFFGAARNMREGGSLTVVATALVETGSKMDDVVYEEFKGTGNMEMVLDRKLSEKRIFPAINIPRSSTRREELLLDKDSLEAMYVMRRALNGMKSDEALERILDMFTRTKNNQEFVTMLRHTKFI